MTKREAKIEALRIVTAMLVYPPDFDEDDRFTENELDKIVSELKILSNSIYKRSLKLGGDFNQYTGY